MMQTSDGDGKIEIIIGEIERPHVLSPQISLEPVFSLVFFGIPQHLGRNIDAVKIESMPEWEEVSPVAASGIEKSSRLPPDGKPGEFFRKDGVVPETVPAGSYAVEFSVFGADCRRFIIHVTNQVKV